MYSLKKEKLIIKTACPILTILSQLITALEYPEYSSVVILCVRKETTLNLFTDIKCTVSTQVDICSYTITKKHIKKELNNKGQCILLIWVWSILAQPESSFLAQIEQVVLKATESRYLVVSYTGKFSHHKIFANFVYLDFTCHTFLLVHTGHLQNIFMKF